MGAKIEWPEVFQWCIIIIFIKKPENKFTRDLVNLQQSTVVAYNSCVVHLFGLAA